MAHAVLSASGAHRWLNCTPSAQLEAKVPDMTSSYAEEGTLAHRLAEARLNAELCGASDVVITETEYQQTLQEIQGHELYSNNMPDYIASYVDHVLEAFADARTRTGDPVICLEQRLDFSRWVPRGFGTGDVIIIADGTMEVIDLKYGKGVAVSAENNPQMMLYALGALDQFGFIYDVNTVRMTICQPRLDSVSSWEITVDELVAWAENELKPKARLAWTGKGEPAAGDWCRFCKVRARCRARAEAAQAAVSAFGFRHPSLLNAEDVASILAKADEIQAWVSDLQTFALEQARDCNVRFPGWKLVEGRSNRRYTDETAVEEALVKARYRKRDIFQVPKLLGITAMEKFLGKKRFRELLDALVVKPPGAPTLVSEDDPRPALNSAADDFDLEDL